MPKTVGNYNILSRLGSGSYAEVFKAVHIKTGEVVAVKVISKEKLGSQKLQENLDREISIMKNFTHPNVVRLLDNFSSGRHIYLVIEHCAGGDLAGYIRRYGRLSEAVVRNFLVQLARGLQFLHSINIIHRDIKPQNLLLSDSTVNAVIKYADFGFAKHLVEAAMAQTPCGTPLYMAPEIFEYKEYDIKADLWSLGCVIFEMLSGTPPFRGSNPRDLYNNIQLRKISFPEGVNVSNELKGLLREMLEVNPTKRITLEMFCVKSEKIVPTEDLVSSQMLITGHLMTANISNATQIDDVNSVSNKPSSTPAKEIGLFPESPVDKKITPKDDSTPDTNGKKPSEPIQIPDNKISNGEQSPTISNKSLVINSPPTTSSTSQYKQSRNSVLSSSPPQPLAPATATAITQLATGNVEPFSNSGSGIAMTPSRGKMEKKQSKGESKSADWMNQEESDDFVMVDSTEKYSEARNSSSVDFDANTLLSIKHTCEYETEIIAQITAIADNLIRESITSSLTMPKQERRDSHVAKISVVLNEEHKSLSISKFTTGDIQSDHANFNSAFSLYIHSMNQLRRLVDKMKEFRKHQDHARMRDFIDKVISGLTIRLGQLYERAEKCKEYIRLDLSYPIAESVIYDAALKFGQNASVEELLGNMEKAGKLYKSARLLIESVLVTTSDAQDKQLLESYAQRFGEHQNKCEQAQKNFSVLFDNKVPLQRGVYNYRKESSTEDLYDSRRRSISLDSATIKNKGNY